MPEDQSWVTRITKVEPNHLAVRGYALDELMGQLSFAEAVYLIFRGELPPPALRGLLDALLVASLDHGSTPPSAIAARNAATTGAPMNAAVASGLLSINRHHGGAIEDAMLLFERTLADKQKQGQTIMQAAEKLVSTTLAAGKRLPGFGHRVHTRDPRTARLFKLAEQAGVNGDYIALARAIQEALHLAGKNLPINVDGAMACLLCELGFPAALGNVFFMIGRVPGLAAQAYEEMTTQKPMRRIDSTTCRYEGPAERSLADAAPGSRQL